jgi:hypothetical protein
MEGILLKVLKNVSPISLDEKSLLIVKTIFCLQKEKTFDFSNFYNRISRGVSLESELNEIKDFSFILVKENQMEKFLFFSKNFLKDLVILIEKN